MSGTVTLSTGKETISWVTLSFEGLNKGMLI